MSPILFKGAILAVFFLQCAKCQSEDISVITEKLIIDNGYSVQKHQAVTEDGYVLSLFRVPSANAGSGKVAFLQHGLLCSSADWLVLGKGKSLAFLLADAGYDVWLGNARGNSNSRQHVSLNTESSKFWDFSWHEIGLYDLPTMIDYVLMETGEDSLHYVGHSQGTTAFFVMASLRPEYNSKIRSMHALAPVAFMSNLVSPFVRMSAPFVDELEWLLKMLGVNEFLPSNEMLVLGGQKACQDSSPIQEVCANVLFLICGYNSAQFNRTLLPTILENTPAGSSVKQFVHYGQGVNSGRFRQFDYGLIKNVVRYGSVVPPSYPLNRVTAPVFLHYGDNDWLAAVQDVEQLNRELGNSVGMFWVADRRWNHLDFTYGTDADVLLYGKIMDFMERWN